MKRMFMWASRRSHPGRRLILLLAVVALVLAVAWATPTPYYVTAPGAAIDTSRLIKVQGGTARHGQLYMLVLADQPANLALYLYAKIDHRADLQTKHEFLGDIPDFDAYVAESQRMMAESQLTARAIGLQQAGYGRGVRPAGSRVISLTPDAPARGYLKAGDVITEAAGKPVLRPDDLRAITAGIMGGTPVNLRVKRGSEELSLTVPTVPHPDPERRGSASFGIYLAAAYDFDIAVPVEINAGSVFGPSAGLMFTLQVVDQLTPGGITGGRRIAGTGTIEPDGSVGPIGGIQQKVYTAEAAGAEVMFVPLDNYAEARQVASRVQLVPVRTAVEALDWLRQHKPQAEHSGSAFWLQ